MNIFGSSTICMGIVTARWEKINNHAVTTLRRGRRGVAKPERLPVVDEPRWQQQQHPSLRG